MLKHTILILLISVSITGNCQNRNNIWCFGDSSLIDFNTQPPSTGESIIRTRGTACSISDSAGNLLFYCGSPHISLWQSGGVYFLGTIYNKNNEIMENGDTLAGEAWYNEMIIISDPGNSQRYYLFHLEEMAQNTGLYYSIIDLSFNSGLGKVITKNNWLLIGNMADGISAVKQGNGRDWWIVARKSDFSTGGMPNNDFYLFSVTPNGIDTLPVQTIGSLNSTNGCSIRFNPTGEKLVFVNWRGLIEEYDFNRCSGIISNPVNIEAEDSLNSPFFWGVEYSLSGQYLYVSVSIPLSYIYQYDTYASNIQASRKTIFTFNQFPNAGGALKRGPDGKIYYALAWNDSVHFNFPYPDTAYNMYNMNLGVINQPDLPDTTCDFRPFSFYLGGKRNYWGLPNNPDYDLGPLVGSGCDTLHLAVREFSKPSCELLIFPNPANDIINFYSEDFTDGELRIFDELGKTILIKQMKYGRASISDLSSGVYSTLLFENDKLVYVKKFIVIK